MTISNVLTLLGGVALFLFGMTLMGDSLKKVAGNKLEIILFRLSGTPLKGLLLGAGVTAVIQSSSATSVMVVGFVNSGIMKLKQAIAIILGAILGTSITGWIISLSSIEGQGWVSLFSTSTLSAVIAIVGILLRMFSKNQRKHHIGEIMLGFSVLMYGMQSMSGAVSPLKNDPAFVSIITAFSNPVLGILFGAAFAAILQSASAAVGILQALSSTGVITFAVAFPVLLGISIGAAVPVLLSAIGAKVNGKRSAFGYLIISIAGSAVCGVIYYALGAFITFPFHDAVLDYVGIALVNTIFRLLTCVLLMPLIGAITAFLTKMIHESEQEKAANEDFDRLDDRFLSHASLAIEQSRITVNSMAMKARENILSAIGLIGNYSDAGYDAVTEMEDYIDRYEDKLGTYLLKLNSNELNEHQNERLSEYLHTLSDFERISDHAMNIAEAAKEISEKKIVFTPAAKAELKVLLEAIREILDISINAFVNENDYAQFTVEPLEERIDVLCDEMKLRHVERMQSGKCSMSVGFVYNDLLTNLERVADHCSNIAIAMIEIGGDLYDTHGYIINLKELREHDFDRLYEQYCVKYEI